jgi:hypothetical protein
MCELLRVKKEEDVDRIESVTTSCYSLDAFFSSRSFLDILAISISGCDQGRGSSSMSRKGLRSHPAWLLLCEWTCKGRSGSPLIEASLVLECEDAHSL